MKMMKLTKTLVVLLTLVGLFVLTSCGQSQIPGLEPDEPDKVDCEKNPEHESCKDEEDDKKEEEDYPYSLGFTIYELQDNTGQLLDGYAVGNYKGEDTEVIVPAMWKEKPIIKIIDGTFENNNKITKVVIPSSVKIFGKNVFAKCTALREVVFEGVSTLQEIPVNTFYECTALRSFTIPASVRKIGESAFYHCASINELVVPTTVKTIGKAAFAAMTSLNKITLPFIGGGNSGSKDGDLLGFVFNNIYTEFTTPMTQKIDEDSTRTYYIPNALKTIEISEGIKELGYGALSGVVSVDKIILPSSITKFGEDAFADATGLSVIAYRGDESKWTEITGRYLEGNRAILESVDIVYSYTE